MGLKQIMNNYDLYHNGYSFNDGRWLAFKEQITAITNLKNINSIAEIGKGSGIVSAVLKELGYKVTTIDIDESLKPDIACSILDIKSQIKRQYDCVLCAEVLEHLKYEDFENALDNIASIGRYVILSLPYVGISLKFSAYLSKIGERKIEFAKRIPLFLSDHAYSNHHYWEIGIKGCSLKSVQKVIEKVFNIEKRWFLPYNHSQVFFQLRVKHCDI